LIYISEGLLDDGLEAEDRKEDRYNNSSNTESLLRIAGEE
jgi:hypothetical protein